ncbi:hypothetical protein JTE90_012394 [Oedothorax gibbosus]|uniref:Uncharacterized protein n=1 Tax=Oedothorax gibbosus TaxID=931172 RepID=A0AAV6TXE9_9ARAC|nr:hypothetical protein JTE90_012394 [Oedothorax gibbosus]
MSGKVYIAAVQLRLNTLYSRARAARGRPEKVSQCSRGFHNPLVADYVQRGLLQRGFTTHAEPKFETTSG